MLNYNFEFLNWFLFKIFMFEFIQRVMGKKHEDCEFEILFLHES
jgi:hypothetical protein